MGAVEGAELRVHEALDLLGGVLRDVVAEGEHPALVGVRVQVEVKREAALRGTRVHEGVRVGLVTVAAATRALCRDAHLVACLLRPLQEHGPDGVDGRVPLRGRVGVAAVEVLAEAVLAVVAAPHAVRVEHRDDLDDELVPEGPGPRVLTQQEAKGPEAHGRAGGLSGVHPGADEEHAPGGEAQGGGTLGAAVGEQGGVVRERLRLSLGCGRQVWELQWVTATARGGG